MEELLAKLSGLASDVSVSAESKLVCLGRGVAGAENGLGRVKFIPGILIPLLGEVIPGVIVEDVEAESVAGESRSKRTPLATLSILAPAAVEERALGARDDRGMVRPLRDGLGGDAPLGEGSADGGAGAFNTGVKSLLGTAGDMGI